MEASRRELLAGGLAAATLGLADCRSRSTGRADQLGPGTEETETATERPETSEPVESSAVESADAAIAAEWNAVRTRVRDAYALGVAGEATGVGAIQAGESYVGTFETAGAHEYYCIPQRNSGDGRGRRRGVSPAMDPTPPAPPLSGIVST